MPSVLIHFPESIFHGNGIQISSMDYVTMSDIQFSYDLLKIEGEDVEKYMNDAINAISTANDVDLMIQEEGTMKGGSIMYEKFREMIDYVKQSTSDAITGRKKMLDELLTPINNPVIESKIKEEALKEEKLEEEIILGEPEPLEKEEKDQEESEKKEEDEAPLETEDVNESESQEPEPEKEEEKASSDSEKPESERNEEHDEEEEEEKHEEDEEFANISDDEGESIIHTEIVFKKKNEDTLMEVLELKMTKLVFQSEN